MTLYATLTGTACCGCFGSMHVNPWITLLAIDLGAVLALAVLAVTTLLPAMNAPAAVTAAYEVLEPETWIGKALYRSWSMSTPASSFKRAHNCYCSIITIAPTAAGPFRSTSKWPAT